MYWLEVAVQTDGEGAEAVAEALRPYAPDSGVVLEQLGDESTPDPDALETAVTVKIYLSSAQDTPTLRRRIEEIIYHLGRLYPIPPPTFQEIKEQDWANAWKTHYHPFRVGKKVWIQPSWVEQGAAADGTDQALPDDVVLTLDPGMAFGTGSHPTTRMCLMVLEELVEPGQRVLDVGTGSAILAVAAVKLGAGSVLGVDIDETAARVAQENAGLNQVNSAITIRQGTLADVTETGWDIVVVNILAPVIINLLKNDGLLDYAARDGRLILSGILAEQMGQVEEAVMGMNGRVIQRQTISDWVALTVQPA